MTRTYITVSIPYVNAAPHLGYALELVQADALARHLRRRGHDVRFLGGTDDHAIKNALAAEAAGVTTGTFVDANAERFAALADPLRVTFDDFIRTSRDPRHRPGVERLWELTDPRGEFYRDTYEGWYCVGCEQFFDEDLGRCRDHDRPLERLTEQNWFFRLSRYADEMGELLTSGRIRIVPEVYANEVLAFLDRGVRDLSVSRSVERARGWGVPVPGDPTQVIYVWWEALANYVTALGFGDPRWSDDYRRWWRDSDHRVHVIGNVVDPVDVVDRFGVDAVRWWLLRDVPPTSDADYTDARLIDRADADLANGIGNLVHRVLTMVQRYQDGRPRVVTTPPKTVHDEAARRAYDEFDFRAAVALVRENVRATNERIEVTRPWELAAKNDREDLDVLLAELVARLTDLAELLEPLVPDLAAGLLELLTPGDDGRLPPPRPLARRLDDTVRAADRHRR